MTCNSFSSWQRPLAKPGVLRPGDRVAIVTPSWGGSACFPQRFEAGLRCLVDEFGLKPVVMPHAKKPADWLDQNPEARASDLMQTFADQEIAAIVTSIGGDDAIRLRPHLDIGVITENPKVFLGYSDATVMHFACLKAGLSSFYGPTVMASFAENGGMHDFKKQAIRRVLFSAAPPGELPRNTEGWTDELLDWSVPGNQDQMRRLQPPTFAKALARLWRDPRPSDRRVCGSSGDAEGHRPLAITPILGRRHPVLRDIRRSSVTFLGDAVDAQLRRARHPQQDSRNDCRSPGRRSGRAAG